METVGGPNFVRYLAPVLRALQKLGGSGRPAEVRELVASDLNLADEVLDELTERGGSRFENQVAWARFYLAKAGYIDASRRGVWTLTTKGTSAPEMTHSQALKLFKDIHSAFGPKTREPSNYAIDISGVPAEETTSPQSSNWREELIARIQSLPAAGFERLCQRLLREAGFEQVTVTGRSGDGGIDGIGILQVNPFVSFKVLFQCKRYVGTVSPSQVRDFRGAMQGRTDKGIIITTGNFTAEARKEAIRDGVPAIELVDAASLAEMFERLELGLYQRVIYEVDPPFFDQFLS
jgi:restriction system protein